MEFIYDSYRVIAYPTGIPSGIKDSKDESFSFPLQTTPVQKLSLLCLTFMLHEVKKCWSSLYLTLQSSNSLEIARDPLKKNAE